MAKSFSLEMIRGKIKGVYCLWWERLIFIPDQLYLLIFYCLWCLDCSYPNIYSPTPSIKNFEKKISLCKYFIFSNFYFFLHSNLMFFEQLRECRNLFRSGGPWTKLSNPQKLHRKSLHQDFWSTKNHRKSYFQVIWYIHCHSKNLDPSSLILKVIMRSLEIHLMLFLEIVHQRTLRQDIRWREKDYRMSLPMLSEERKFSHQMSLVIDIRFCFF